MAIVRGGGREGKCEQADREAACMRRGSVAALTCSVGSIMNLCLTHAVARVASAAFVGPEMVNPDAVKNDARFAVYVETSTRAKSKSESLSRRCGQADPHS